MDNAMKAIMIGVGLFITIAVVSAVLIIMGMGNDIINTSTEELTGLSGQLANEMYSKFDDKQVSGSQVIAAVKQYYNKNNIGIILYNKRKNATPVYTGAKILTIQGIKNSYDAGMSSSTFDLSDGITSVKFTEGGMGAGQKAPLSTFSKTEQTDYYIAPNAQYQAFCVKQNGTLVGLVFYMI